MSNIPKKGWKEIEAKDISDIINDNGIIRKKSLAEKAKEIMVLKLTELKQSYASAAAQTDARFSQYNKRKELGILDEDDERDYQEALDYYKKITEQYRQKKAELKQIKDIEQLRNFDTSIG